MKIAIDIHDCITAQPKAIKEIMDAFEVLGNEVYLITGTPKRLAKQVKAKLAEHKIFSTDYKTILWGFDYDTEKKEKIHFTTMAEWKLGHLQENKIDIYIDDNPFYVNYMKDHGITTLQLILPTEYIEKYGEADVIKTSHFQRDQFNFLNDIKI